VLLVDDVPTSGATAAACAAALGAVGAARVDLLVAARTVREEGDEEDP
jgi:predicted amidophosphoribosyltransferase